MERCHADLLFQEEKCRRLGKLLAFLGRESAAASGGRIGRTDAFNISPDWTDCQHVTVNTAVINVPALAPFPHHKRRLFKTKKPF